MDKEENKLAVEALQKTKLELSLEKNVLIKKIEDIDKKFEAINISIKCLQESKTETNAPDHAVEFVINNLPTETKQRIISILNNSQRLLKKEDIEKQIASLAGSSSNIRPAIKTLIKNRRLASVAFNNSRQFTFLALPDWIEGKGSHAKLKRGYNPSRIEVPFEVEETIIKIGNNGKIKASEYSEA